MNFALAFVNKVQIFSAVISARSIKGFIAYGRKCTYHSKHNTDKSFYLPTHIILTGYELSTGGALGYKSNQKMRGGGIFIG